MLRKQSTRERPKADRSPGRLSGCERLFLINEMSAAILLPALFVGLGAERLFLAVADHIGAAGIDCCRG